MITGCWHLPGFYLSKPVFNPTSFFFWLKQGMLRARRRALSLVYKQLQCLHFNLVRLFRLYRRGWFPSHDNSHWMQDKPAIRSLSVRHELFMCRRTCLSLLNILVPRLFSFLLKMEISVLYKTKELNETNHQKLSR